MKKNIIKLLALVAAFHLLSDKALAQQQFSFTQYMNNLTLVNPAYATTFDNTNISAVGRRQLIGINGAPTTYLFNGSTPINSIGGAAGIILLNDNDPVYKNTEINVFFAKKIQLSGSNYLSAAVNAGFRNNKANFSQVDPSDPKFQTGDVNETIANVGFSVMVYGNDYYAGISVPRFTLGQTTSNSNLQNSYYLSAGWLKKINDDFKIKPAALLAYSGSNLPMSYDVSATLYIKDVVGIGANYHRDNAFAGILSLYATPNFMLGYSYQFTVGKYALGGVNNSTQEITLSYRFGKGGVKLL